MFLFIVVMCIDCLAISFILHYVQWVCYALSVCHVQCMPYCACSVWFCLSRHAARHILYMQGTVCLVCVHYILLSVSSSMVIRDLTLRSAASFGSFHLIRLLYDEFMFYLVEHKVANATGETPIAVMGELRQVTPYLLQLFLLFMSCACCPSCSN